MRREIEEAIAYNRKIVPITPDKECESFPVGLPDTLRKTFNGLQITTIYTDHMFEAGIDFLVKNRFHLNRVQDDSKSDRNIIEEDRNKMVKSVSDGLVFNVNGVEFKMVEVEGGSFWMGADNGKRIRTVTVGLFRKEERQEEYVDHGVRNYDGEAFDDEKPVHSVRLRSFYMAETEVTQALWEAVMGREPLYNGGWKDVCGRGRDYPAYRINWDDIQEFIRKLNQKTGRDFRLPSEAEWEYAARGGKKSQGYKYAGSNAIDGVAWYYNNSENKPHPVKTKLPNELGLYDMSGNVWEWCQDYYGSYSYGSQTNPQGLSSSLYRVLRGGSWYYRARLCRVSRRFDCGSNHGSDDRGFRLALSL